MEKKTVFAEVDKKLQQAKSRIKFLDNIRINYLNETDQKKLFLQGRVDNPSFRYTASQQHNHANYTSFLDSISVPSGLPMSDLYNGIKSDRLLESEIIHSCGDSGVSIPNSIKIYGEPLHTIRDKAIRILSSDILYKTTPATVSASQLKSNLERALEIAGVSDWNVTFSDKKETTVYDTLSEISVCKNRLFTQDDLLRLPVHEIGGHVLRAMNGREQKYGLFSMGLPGYEETEEGVTTYLEHITGMLSQSLLRTYAGRFIAVESVFHNSSFSDTFQELESFHFSPDDAWSLSVRAHRAGGLIKDHIYLQGFHNVSNYMQSGGKLDSLFIGKIGLENLELVEKMQADGDITPPKYLPDDILSFFRKE